MAESFDLDLVEEKYGVKHDMLVSGVTPVLQAILQEKIFIMEINTGQDFFEKLLKKNWVPAEKEKIAKRSVDELDLTLCVRFLLDTKWKPHPKAALTQPEKEAINSLRILRNDAKHLVETSDREAIKTAFAQNCEKVRNALQVLDWPDWEVDDIIEKASETITMQRTQLLSIKQSEFLSKFETVDILGSGSFGIVLRVRDKQLGVHSAIKMIPNRIQGLKPEDNDMILKEARCWSKFQHENVVSYKYSNFFSLMPKVLKDILDVGENAKEILERTEFILACFASEKPVKGLYIQTELCGKTLRQWIKEQGPISTNPKERVQQMQLEKRKEICKGLIQGLSYIHRKNFIHRDLRPENVYFSENEFQTPVKIGDFGICNQLRSGDEFETLSKEVGNSLYRAPEIEAGHPNEEKAKDGKAHYGTPVDLYALGLTIAEIYDPNPFKGLRRKFDHIVWKEDTGDIREIYGSKISDLIILLTRQDPNERRKTKLSYEKEFFPYFEKNQTEHVNEKLRVLRLVDVVDERERAYITMRPTPPLPQTTQTIVGRRLNSMESLSSRSNSRPQMQNDYGSDSDRSSPDRNNTVLRELRSQGHASARPNYQAFEASQNFMPAPKQVYEGPLKYDCITILRKNILQRSPLLWTGGNMAKFFNFLEPTKKHTPSTFGSQTPEDPVNRFSVNSNLYRIHKENPFRMTRTNLKTALNNIGFREEANKVDTLLNFD